MLNECVRVVALGSIALIGVIRRWQILALVEGVFRTSFTRREVRELLAP